MESPVKSLALLVGLFMTTSAFGAAQPGLLESEFIFESAPFPQCHASTIAETKAGLVAAWFGGTRERDPDVGIWLSRHVGDSWTPPVEVANGAGFFTNRFPCWNPVLFQPKTGPLLLFYKVGPSPSTWWGMLTTSADGGKTWSKPRRLPDGILGPPHQPVRAGLQMVDLLGADITDLHQVTSGNPASARRVIVVDELAMLMWPSNARAVRSGTSLKIRTPSAGYAIPARPHHAAQFSPQTAPHSRPQKLSP